MALAFHHEKLPNGLSVIAECNPDAHTAAAGFFVKTGARDEEAAVMGVSHFLEHMMFKGSEHLTADDVNRRFDELGANYNAFTSHENTVYYAHVLPEYLTAAVELLGTMLRPSLRPDDFDMEKKVILEEIGMYDDRPHWRLHDAILDTYFQGSPLGYRVLGTTESVGALCVEQMRAYFDQRYSPDNITLAVAGRLDVDRLLADVTHLTHGWTPTAPTRTQQQAQAVERQQTLVDDKVSRHYMAMMCPAPSSADPRRYAATVLADILGDDDGSRLYWALVDPGLADEADFTYFPQDGVGSFVAFASCDPQRAQQVESIWLKTIDGIVDQLETGELERAKNKLATQATLHGEYPAGRMRSLGHQWVNLGQYIPLEVELQRLMAVSVQDVKALMDDMPLRKDRRTVVRLGPPQAT